MVVSAAGVWALKAVLKKSKAASKSFGSIRAIIGTHRRDRPRQLERYGAAIVAIVLLPVMLSRDEAGRMVDDW